MRALRVLFIEDTPEDAEILALELEASGYSLERRLRVWTRADLKAALADGPWDLVIGDYSLPDCPSVDGGPALSFDGLEALAMVRAHDAGLPFIMVSGKVGEELAVTAMRAGASDFLVKGRMRRLGPAVDRELRDHEARQDRLRAEAALQESEEQLRQAQRMESVGRLAGGIAHDFNNILSVVSGYTNLLQMRLARAGTSHRELAEIEKAVLRASALVRQLLAFSRRQVVHRRPLDMGQVLMDSLQVMSMMLGEDVVVETSVEDSLPRILADRGQMEQVILNLASNARDAMPRGGTLRIAVSTCDLDGTHFREDEKRQPGPHVRLEVEDNGVGMDQGVLSRIFEPFFTTKGPGAGAGLGLSTVYGIVRQAGGTIRVRSLRYAGSCFSVFLPVAAARDLERAGSTPGGRAGSRGESILLVEDDVDLRRLAKDLLVMEGYRVLEARDVDEAMGFARSLDIPADLLLTDLVMPRRNGRDLADAVQALRPGIRVIFMSGYAPETLMPDGGWPEAVFLEKPFTAAGLLAKVRTALDAPKAEKQL